MMRLELHPQNPQANRVKQVVDIINNNGIIVYPTESGYAIGCSLDNKAGLQQIQQIRQLSKRHHFTLMLRDLAHIGDYAQVSNTNFRLLKKALPNAYTFILPATKLVPSRLLHAKRKTIGIRVSSHIFVQQLLAQLNTPMMSVSLRLEQDYYDIDDVWESVGNQVDCVIDMGYCVCEPTTVVDLVETPTLIRQGSASSDFLN